MGKYVVGIIYLLLIPIWFPIVVLGLLVSIFMAEYHKRVIRPLLLIHVRR